MLSSYKQVFREKGCWRRAHFEGKIMNEQEEKRGKRGDGKGLHQLSPESLANIAKENG